MTAPKRYTARAEAVRCAEEVLTRKGAGQSLAAIYDDLIARGELSMGLRTFQKWMKRFEEGERFVPLQEAMLGPAAADGEAAQRPNIRTDDPDVSAPSPALSSGLRHARIGTPLPSMPNTTPDMKALFGDDD